jgi:hypothetical protein
LNWPSEIPASKGHAHVVCPTGKHATADPFVFWQSTVNEIAIVAVDPLPHDVESVLFPVGSEITLAAGIPTDMFGAKRAIVVEKLDLWDHSANCCSVASRFSAVKYVDDCPSRPRWDVDLGNAPARFGDPIAHTRIYSGFQR